RVRIGGERAGRRKGLDQVPVDVEPGVRAVVGADEQRPGEAGHRVRDGDVDVRLAGPDVHAGAGVLVDGEVVVLVDGAADLLRDGGDVVDRDVAFEIDPGGHAHLIDDRVRAVRPRHLDVARA